MIKKIQISVALIIGAHMLFSCKNSSEGITSIEQATSRTGFKIGWGYRFHYTIIQTRKCDKFIGILFIDPTFKMPDNNLGNSYLSNNPNYQAKTIPFSYVNQEYNTQKYRTVIWWRSFEK